MIVDFKDSGFAAFDGSKHSSVQLSNNVIFGQNLLDLSMSITTFIGIIHFSSKYTYTTSKSNIIRKDCTPFIKYFPKVLAKTKKIDQTKDLYAILKIENIVNNIIYCDVVQYLGEICDQSIESKFVQIACSSHWTNTKRINQQFQEKSNIDLTPNRKDYTHIDIYSIDPGGCVDIDDALHCIRIDDGYEVGIHIADVSSYIDENSELDHELGHRVETIYPPNSSPVHMIPHELSIEHISLLEGKPKRAFSVIIKLNDMFDIQSISFEKTIIKVKNLTYEKGEEMKDILFDMYTVGQKLKKNIELAFPKDEVYDMHQMVAVYMIYANKFVAEKIQSYDPNNVLLRSLRSSVIGTTINCAESNEAILFKKHNINLMEQARYQLGSNDCAHQGLNLAFYTHFTSPIRRYADIIVHRQLWKAINSQKIERIEAKTIFLMNFYSKFYKQTERYYHIMTIANILGNEYDITDAYITYIDESIKLYIPKYNLDYDYQICNYRMNNIISVIRDNNSVTIKNIQTDEETRYELFQKVSVKIIATTNHAIKLNVSIKHF